MSPTATPAIVLHGFKYGDTSKIVRLATPQHGVVSAIAKGALQPRSPFGARLQLLAEGTAQIYLRPHRDLQTMASFEVTRERESLARDVGRFAAASLLAELVLRCSPAEPQEGLYRALVEGLDALAAVAPPALPSASLGAAWQLVAALGFAPALDDCAADGRPVADGPAPFSVEHGGILCGSCGRGTGRKLPAADRRLLRAFVRGDHDAEASLPRARALAHRRLLARFVRHHLSEGRDLRALDFWEAQPWLGTS